MSEREVFYSCSSCGYPLNLRSSHRTPSEECSKLTKKGFVPFACIDHSRFTQVDEVLCFPFGRNRPKTKLLCRKCGIHLGHGFGESAALCVFHSPNSLRSSYNKFYLNILAIQPSTEGYTP